MSVHDLISIVVLSILAVTGASVLGFQVLTGVPPMSSNAAEGADVVALLRQAGLPPGAIIYELGSGWGSLAIALAQAFPDAQVRGIEISPLPYWVSRLRTRGLANLSLRRGDFYGQDLRDADAVTCYLMTRPMPKLAGFLDGTLRFGTPVVALSFWFRDRDVDRSLKSAGLLSAAALYYWPAHKSG